MLIVGGAKLCFIAINVVTTPAAPDAPCAWPIIDFVELAGMLQALSPNAIRTAADSVRSLIFVAVP